MSKPLPAIRTNKRDAALALFLMGAVYLCGCAAKDAGEETPTVTVQVGAAEKEAIKQEISADATLYPRDQAAIVPRVNAPVRKFFVDRGSKVRAGEVLAELEDTELGSAVQENQGSYQEAEANYQTAAQKAEQDVKLAKEQLDAQQRVFDNRESLLKEGAVSAKDVEDARIALTQARDQYEVAEKQFDLKAAEGQLRAAKAKSSGAEAQLSYAKIVSPIDGVVADRPIYPGELPPVGSPILTVIDSSQVIARAHVSQQEAAQLKVGDAATVSGPDGASVPGSVSLVSPALDPNSTTVEVWVQAANPDAKLKPGASARVKMVAQTIPHAVVIPAESLLTGADGTTSVIVLDSNNAPQKQKVKVGIRNGDDVQVTEGLRGGERVVTVGAFELSNEDDDVLPKTKIQVQAPKMPAEDEDQ